MRNAASVDINGLLSCARYYGADVQSIKLSDALHTVLGLFRKDILEQDAHLSAALEVAEEPEWLSGEIMWRLNNYTNRFK